MSERFPLLRGFLVKRGKMILCWCPFCDVFHVHGWPSGRKKTTAEHRVAHCNYGSPWQNKGYYIKPFAISSIRDTRVTVKPRPEKNKKK